MNHPKSIKKCLVTYKMLQNFPVFQLGKEHEKCMILLNVDTFTSQIEV